MRNSKSQANAYSSESYRKSYAVLLGMIALVALSACSSHGDSAFAKTSIASRHKPQPLTASSESCPTSFEYVQLLDQDSWVIADPYQLWRTEDSGRTWRQIYGVRPDSSEGKHIGGLSFIDAKRGFLIVDRLFFGTEDGGVGWNQLSELHFGAQSCYFVDALHGWAAGSVWQEGYAKDSTVPMYAGVVFASKDGGRTWQQQRTDLPEGYFEAGARWSLRDVFFKDGRTGWAVGDGVVFWTMDGGEEWQVNDNAKGRYKQVRFIDEQFGWITSYQAAEFLITMDGGRHWKFLNGPQGYGAHSTNVVFLSQTRGFATLLNLYETKNGGHSWMQLSGSNDKGEAAYEYVGEAQDGAIVALGPKGKTVVSLVSTDKGLTWKSNSQASDQREVDSAKNDTWESASAIRKSDEDLSRLALHKAEPVYPAIAKSARASGAIAVEIVVDERGNVVSARALSGHPLLRDAAVTAARSWKFKPTQSNGMPTKLIGTVTINFSPPYER